MGELLLKYDNAEQMINMIENMDNMDKDVHIKVS